MDPISLIIFITLISLSAFFSWTEMALMTISQHKIESLIKQNKSWAHALKKIKSKNDKLLITILIWNNLVNVWASSLATLMTISMADKLNLPWSYSIWIATWVVTLILLLFWEITPKSLCSKYSEKISLTVAPIYVFLMFVLTPITIFIEWFVKIANFFAWKNNSQNIMSSEELEAFLDISRERWAVEEEEHKKIKWILDLWDTEASSIMTPRIQVEFVSLSMTINEVCDFFLANSHSRLPVYNKHRDDVNFVITFREAFTFKSKGLWEEKLSNLKLNKIIKVPLNQPVDVIFETFQKSRRHIALVIDEYGWVAWVITLEDIIEEVFGDIKDEYDKEEIFIRRVGENELVVKGEVLIEDILEEFETTCSDIWIEENFTWETIAYVITSILERFPDNWEEIILEWKEFNLKLKISEIINSKINEIIIEKVEKIEE